jgi:hypothetical protein
MASPAGYPFTRVFTASASLDFDLSGATFQDKTVVVPGCQLSDFVVVGVPHAAISNGVSYHGWVSAAGTVTIRGTTSTGTPNPAAGTFKVLVIQQRVG